VGQERNILDLDRNMGSVTALGGTSAMYIPGLDVRLTARYGLAILRVVLGIAMLVHGWSKLSGGVDNVAGFFGGVLGIPAPGLMAWVVTIVELVGGILLVVGFLSQIAGILIALDMLGAILFAFLLRGAPFIENGAITWEKEAVFAAAALCIALAGPGAWSVDDVVAENRARVVT
jgi:putative oxidoreductase